VNLLLKNKITQGGLNGLVYFMIALTAVSLEIIFRDVLFERETSLRLYVFMALPLALVFATTTITTIF